MCGKLYEKEFKNGYTYLQSISTTMIEEWMGEEERRKKQQKRKKRKMHSTGYCIPVTKSHNVWTNVVRICGFSETKLSLKTSYG